MTWAALRSLAVQQAALLCPPLPAGARCCAVCRGPVRPGYPHCYQCRTHQAVARGLLADVVVPVSYAIAGTRYATAMWLYKSGSPAAGAVQAYLRALLLVFLRDHGPCAWRYAGMPPPTHCAVVPGGRGRRGAHPLRGLMAPYLATPWASLAVRPGGEPMGRGLDAARFEAGPLPGASVLLLDDTWVSGASAQSAAAALKLAGARHVAVMVLGRHVNPADPRALVFARALAGRAFRPGECAVHGGPDECAVHAGPTAAAVRAAGAQYAVTVTTAPASPTAPASRTALVRRARRINRELAELYPDAHCELDFTTPLELLVATILSAQCTDRRVNMVTPTVFARYRSAADYAAADRAELEKIIQTTGFFRAKTNSLIGLGQALCDRFGGEVPGRLSDLVTLPGVGRKTANVVLGNAFGVPGLTVDTHFARLARRFGWTASTDADKVEAEVGALFPRSEWTMLSHRLIWHGRRICHSRRPACGACALARLCPAFGEGPVDEATARKLVKAGPFS